MAQISSTNVDSLLNSGATMGTVIAAATPANVASNTVTSQPDVVQMAKPMATTTSHSSAIKASEAQAPPAPEKWRGVIAHDHSPATISLLQMPNTSEYHDIVTVGLAFALVMYKKTQACIQAGAQVLGASETWQNLLNAMAVAFVFILLKRVT